MNHEDRRTAEPRLIRPAGLTLARALPLAGLAIVMSFAFSAVPAFAEQQPTIGSQPFEEQIYSTRVRLLPNIIPADAETEWRAEYAAAEESDEEPPPGDAVNNPSAWTLTGSGFTGGAGFIHPELGAYDPPGTFGNRYLHHLVPNTVYYARFVARNSAGESTRLFKFKTADTTKPELLNLREPGSHGYGTFAAGFHSARAKAQFETNGLEISKYSFAYSTSQTGPWTSVCEGTVTVAEDFADPECEFTGLLSETQYFVRARATNSKGTGEEISTFTTPTAKPIVNLLAIRNITAASAHFLDALIPSGSETHWRFEYATATTGPWAPVPGAAGTVSQAQAEALPFEVGGVETFGTLTGLEPSKVYYVRLVAENEAGSATSNVAHFETVGPPTAATFALHALHGEALRLLGSVNPRNVRTSEEQEIALTGSPTGGTFTLTFEGQTTTPIAFDAPADGSDSVKAALNSLPVIKAGNKEGGMISVGGPAAGPYTVFFENSAGETDQPQIEANGSGLTPSGGVTVTTVQQGGEGYDTHYHFEYEPLGGGGEPFANATSIEELDAGTGNEDISVGEDVPGLEAGRSYRYRIVAVNQLAPAGVPGEEQTLTVSAPAAPSPEGPCENQALRTGPSANLPDCRAYEQVTPTNKEGSQELFNYGNNTVEGVLTGEDGNHLMVGAPVVSWGSGPGAGGSPYFFSREAAGWRMTSGSPQPETGVDLNEPQIFSSDLTEFGFESGVHTSVGEGESTEVAFRAGRPGGPDATVATLPRKEVGSDGGWAGASADFSTLVLQLEDHHLIEETPTGTSSGYDLYEYRHGQLLQANVNGAGETIGRCGARLVRGRELENNGLSSPYAVSTDGHRVFFEAIPSVSCSQPRHLYMRDTETGETFDIGEYVFVEANPSGTVVLVSHNGLFRYDTEAHSTEPVAEDETLSQQRYSYFKGTAFAWEFGAKHDLPDQVIRVDNADHLVECLSCASPFNPEPALGAAFGVDRYFDLSRTGLPHLRDVSANGDLAFFDTPSALVSQDVDGEIEPEPVQGVNPSREFSLSSDVYEWRADGVDGCAHLQGCLALITDGRGGQLNVLLGTAEEGRDVFVYTRSQLLPSDRDTAGDVYDARIGGGFAPPPALPVECEGDACHRPAVAPPEPTLSTSVPSGPGNERPAKPRKPRKHRHKRKHGGSHRHGSRRHRANHNRGGVK